MSTEIISQGSLFTSDLLTDTIRNVSEWAALSESDLDDFTVRLRASFDRFPVTQTPNESQTEDDLIWPILGALGWHDSLRQQNLSAKGREDVPDGLLFEDAATKAQAAQTTGIASFRNPQHTSKMLRVSASQSSYPRRNR